jgi:alpha-glucosidase
MYYGQELGMLTTPPARKEDVKDPIGITGWPREKGRDGERTPMQWDDTKNAGFSTSGTTWLPVTANYQEVNVKTEENNPNSLLNWYKQLIAKRKSNPALRDGSMMMLDETNPSVLSYLRKGPAGQPSVLVSLNCTGQQQTVTLDLNKYGVTRKNVSTLMTDADSLKQQSTLTITLPPYASWIGSLQ